MLAFSASICIGLAVGLWFYFGLDRALKLRFEKQDRKVSLPLMFKVFLPFTGQLRPIVQRSTFTQALAQADVRLVQGGLDQELEPEQFMAIRLLYAASFFVIGIFFIGLGSGLPLFLGLLMIMFGLVFPNLWLANQIKARHRSIQRALPSVLDLLTLSVEAGRDFLTALKDILNHRSSDPLGDELERVFREIQLGKQRRDALRAMGERVRQPDLTSAVDAMVQADELGISLGSILRILGTKCAPSGFTMLKIGK